MNLDWKTLQTWWRNREARERHVLLGGAVVVALVLGWALVWHPLSVARDTAAARMQAGQQDLAFMKSAVAQMRARSKRDASVAPRGGKSLLALADASARAVNLGGALQRVEPLDRGRVRVEFRQAGFDQLASWLAGLRRDYGIRVEDFSASRIGGVGLVDARVTLTESTMQTVSP